jgi:transcription initiation factor TFIIB
MATSDHTERRTEKEDKIEPDGGCPECGGEVRNGQAESVCVSCGLVLDDQPIDTGPEWRAFDTDERERTGAPLTPARHDRGLSTELWGNTDANGDPVSARKRRQLGRLKREHTRAKWRSKAERNLAHGISETRRIVSTLDLPQSIRDQACQLFRSAANDKLLLGRSIEAVAAASVYGACRCNGLPRTLEEVVAASAVNHSRVENAYQVLNRELGIPAVPPSPTEFIPRLVSELSLSDGTRQLAEDLAERAVEAGIGNGCHPGGLAAGCVYAAAQSRLERVTQTELAECVDVTPVTVRSRWVELRPLIGG